MSGLALTLLGGLAARRADGVPVRLGRRKAAALVAYLACPAGRAHDRDALATLLWPDAPAARNNLRQLLLRLRQALPPGALCIDETTVALDPSGIEVDVAAFEGRVACGTPAALAEAGRLYAGDSLAGLDVEESTIEEWLGAERERLRELALETFGQLLATRRCGSTRSASSCCNESSGWNRKK